MGILDDAIREHLDLKRRQGAADSEIERLESEAFGPPTRPGEPDFPESQQSAGAATEVAESPPETAEEPQAPPRAAEEAEPALFDHSAGADAPPVAPPAEESPPVTDTAPAPEPSPVEPALELDDPAAHLESLAEPAAPPQSEPPIESLDTVEHHFEEAIEDTGEAPAVAPQPGEQPLDPGEDEEVVSGEVEDEDVLEETPEFLRDQPEDDELWFEQGEPKDFDF